MCAKRNRQMTLWLTNLTLRSGVNQSTETDLHPLSSIRILVVDDFKDWLRQVRLLLQPRPKSHVIAEASDGLEAVQKAEDLKPDLILLDIGLPKLNGIEAARQIRQRSPSSKIIFLSQNSASTSSGQLWARARWTMFIRAMPEGNYCLPWMRFLVVNNLPAVAQTASSEKPKRGSILL